jgi:drug/metabolite transporter (DMT)-like permease
MNTQSAAAPSRTAGLWFAAMLALAIVTWGSAFPAIRACLRDLQPNHLAVGRMIVASCVLALCLPWSPVRWPARRDLAGLFLMGFLGIAVYHTALSYGEVTVPAGAASFLIAASPVFSLLGSMALLGERPRARCWLGMGVCFGGVGLIALSTSGGLRFSGDIGLLILAAAAGGLYSVVQKCFVQRYSAHELVCYAIWSGTLCMLIFARGIIPALHQASATTLLALVYLGVAPAALAYGIWAWVLRHMTVTRAVSFQYLIPLVALVIAYLWLDERPAWLALLGGALTIGGVAVVNTARP